MEEIVNNDDPKKVKNKHTIWRSNATTWRQVLEIVLYGSKLERKKKKVLEESVVTNRIIGRIGVAIKKVRCEFSIK